VQAAFDPAFAAHRSGLRLFLAVDAATTIISNCDTILDARALLRNAPGVRLNEMNN